ncbi:MAG: hypothetical protein E3J25_03450 [Anaerolineales bacterium]|nr:MAG: hypothetical protein E3J25_03450 [Anaerolineales bacterium]
MRDKGLRRDIAIILALFLLSILFFWPVTLGGRTLLPADNAFAWQPWKSFANEVGVGVPHNGLLSDLYLENYVWKRFIVSSLRAKEIPLWNPYILAGVPFLAAGQHSAMYPLSVIFYVLPIPLAYGYFAAIHLFLAGAFTYLLARTLRVGRAGSTVSAISFMFGGFMVIRNVFPMIVAAAVWLPLILVAIERIVARAERGRCRVINHVPDLVFGSLAFGMVFLAGHPEMYYYVALTSALFALWRLARLALHQRPFTTGCQRRWQPLSAAALALVTMVILGMGLGTGQWLPLLQLVPLNFRQGGASLEEVLGWAYPLRRVISLLVPDFFGNPAHHVYFDLFSWKWVPATVNALGQPIDTIYWGIKNYVEGASYVGLLPFLLAAIAVLWHRGRHIWFFVLVSVFSLLFVFGSPLYVLVYKLPGLSQVHSPFRWIYPYSLCMAILAGMGLDALCHDGGEQARSWWGNLTRKLATLVVPRLALFGGVIVLGGLAVSLAFKESCASLAERAMHRLTLAPQAFADGRMFYSYQFRNLLVFGGALLLGGVVLSLRSMAQRAMRQPALWGALVAAVALGELFLIGRPFFPAVDPRLVGYRTPVVDFLKADPDLYRITSYVGGNEKTFNANAGMFYDIADVRGYDSIVPRQYADYMGLIQEQTELQYNRIAPIFTSHPEALDSPLLDLLNVKYVLTNRERSIDNSGYTLVYEDEIRVYRNDGYLPRAFLVPKAVSISNPEERRVALRAFDPREMVILEEPLPGESVDHAPPGFSSEVEAIDHTPNEVTITATATIPCYLVLADSFFDGWLAFIRPPDVEDPTLAETSLHIYRANGNFRAVALPAGRHVVRFRYSPNVVKFGLYTSFLSGLILILGMGLWAWVRFYREARADAVVQRVTKNTLAPIALSLVNKVVDMAFAMLMLRMLGPANAGEYYFAIAVISWFDILTSFGLNTLLTREIAKDREQAPSYLCNSVIVRLGLCMGSAPILALFFLAQHLTASLETSTVLALALFWVALVPSNIAASFGAVFNAYERMEVPAGVTTLTTLLKVSLGAIALIVGTGYVGLAAVSIVVNLATMIVLYLLVRALLFHPRIQIDLSLQKRMISTSYPLMINHLLATLFFRVAVVLLRLRIEDPRVVGWYSTAYKYIDAAQVLPAYFTMAIFPMMARHASADKTSLSKAYRLAVKLLLIAALPGALLGWALSHELIAILGGSQYLPYAAPILRVMIWYMPFGFVNSVTQYVLIALDQQRFLTRAFAIGVAFNVIANLVLIDRIGYMASAYVAIASEFILLIPFLVGVHRHLGRLSWLLPALKPVLAALPMTLLLVFLPRHKMALSIAVGLVSYGVSLCLLHVFDAEEREAVKRALPLGRIRTWVAGLLARDAA